MTYLPDCDPYERDALLIGAACFIASVILLGVFAFFCI